MNRFFEIIASFIGLFVSLPLFIIISIFIKLDSAGSVFFIQKRVGRDFKPFRLYKFRTMVSDAQQKGPSITAHGDARITRIGKFLRKTKIDELPQLLNVLKGDMGLVGPRPEVSKYVEMFRDEYQEILRIKPGITDYATIEFRDEEGILRKYKNPEDGYVNEVLPLKIEMYKKYIKDKSLSTDIKLIFLTLREIIKR